MAHRQTWYIALQNMITSDNTDHSGLDACGGCRNMAQEHKGSNVRLSAVRWDLKSEEGP